MECTCIDKEMENNKRGKVSEGWKKEKIKNRKMLSTSLLYNEIITLKIFTHIFSVLS